MILGLTKEGGGEADVPELCFLYNRSTESPASASPPVPLPELILLLPLLSYSS